MKIRPDQLAALEAGRKKSARRSLLASFRDQGLTAKEDADTGKVFLQDEGGGEATLSFGDRRLDVTTGETEFKWKGLEGE